MDKEKEVLEILNRPLVIHFDNKLGGRDKLFEETYESLIPEIAKEISKLISQAQEQKEKEIRDRIWERLSHLSREVNYLLSIFKEN